MDNQLKNQCQTLDRYEPDGTPIYKYKKKFDTLDEAIEECKIQNAMPDKIHKLVSYKCNICHKYHIGRNGKEITKKLKSKLQRLYPSKEELELRKKKSHQLSLSLADFKIVGKIDLTKLRIK